ncbi:MAG: MotA/TolQ/ExbB proton channel family protein [Hyphomicrobiales bacterium]
MRKSVNINMTLRIRTKTIRATDPQPFYYFLLWLLMFSLIVFFGFVMIDQGYGEKVLEADRSYISFLITAVFLASSIYCAIHIFKSCQNLIRAEKLIQSVKGTSTTIESSRDTEQESLVDDFINELSKIQKTPENEKSENGINQANYIFEIYVDELRSPSEILGFIIDVLIRLGLIGTIIGFILMLQSFVSGPNPSAENIQDLLITMSSGMGTALYTTFAGLIASTLLGIQQILLNKNVEQIIASLIRLSDKQSLKLLTANIHTKTIMAADNNQHVKG